MTKETLFVLCASLCLSFALPTTAEGQAVASRKEVRKAPPGRASADSLHGERGLLADRLEIKKKISDQKKLREIELKEELAEEALEDPGIDLYGEDSWNNSVNPLTSSANIPSTYDIDLNEFVMPIESRRVTSHFGYRRRFGRFHYGIDIGLSVGDTVRSAFSGKVRVVAYNRGGYGNYIIVRHPNGLETVYGHLHRQMVREGDIVKAGGVIGLGGNTGRSTGPHLHFETRFMGIALNPNILFDFEQGVPRTDVYTFHKGSRQQATSAYATAKSAKKSKKGSAIRTYRVRKGDTLSAIARRNGTTVSKIATLNGISTRAKLSPGKSLRVS